MNFQVYRDLNPWLQGRKLRSCEFGRLDDELTLLLDNEVVHLRGEQVTAVEVETSTDYPLVRALPEGGFVLLEVPHATILDTDGKPVVRFPTGPAVEHLAVDASGRIWLGYYDEGAGRPISENGLNCFAPDGELERGYHELGILSCYALNVAKDAVWLCYHSGFPLVRIAPDGQVECWSNKVQGAKALVAHGQQVALYGDYDHSHRVSVIDLHPEGHSTLRSVHTATLENGESPGWVQSQGRTFHTLKNGLWHRLEWTGAP